MAAKSNSGLGRGLGSLIPSGGNNVSRETKQALRALDLLVPSQGGEEETKPRANADVTRELLKPGSSRKKRKEPRRAATPTPSREPQTPTRPNPPAQNTELFAGIIGDEASGELLPVEGAQFAELPTSVIIANRQQPRINFDEDDLLELADSIRQVGILQPVVVRPLSTEAPDYPDLVRAHRDNGAETDPLFELIMGERRLRAAKLAGLTTIPAIIRDTTDADLLRDALLENLHRAQLNPLEEAAAYQQLLDDFGCTQEQLADRIARSRPQITNTLRLLKLPPTVQTKLAAGVISAGHARALLGLESTALMAAYAERIVAEGLSVRSTEELVMIGEEPPATKSARRRAVKPLSDTARLVEENLEELLETRVSVREGKRKGRIVIEYAGSDDLERIRAIVDELQKR